VSNIPNPNIKRKKFQANPSFGQHEFLLRLYRLQGGRRYKFVHHNAAP
jgi:hypothetical protein